MDKILTLIIPAYNMERYLDRCLSSLIVDEKHMMMFEALIINDGSTDRTSEIGHQYEARRPESFRVIDKENGHYGSCVNRGLSEAKGVFIKILDADDFFDTLVFKCFLDFLSSEEVKSNADLVLSDYVSIFEDSDSKLLQEYRSPSPASISQICTYDRFKWFIHGLTYKSNILKSIEYKQIEGIPYTDNQWSLEPMIAVKTIYRFSNPLYCYSIGREDQSISDENHSKYLDKEISVIEYLISFYCQKSPSMEDNLRGFFKERLVLSIENIYQLALLTLNRKFIDDNLLNSFDQHLKNTCEELYSITNGYSTHVLRVKCRIIKHWREKSPLLRIEQAIYNITNRINQLKSTI